MRFFFSALFFLTFLTSVSLAQVSEMSSAMVPTPAAERLSSFDLRLQEAQQSLVSDVVFDNIGPTVMSGRIVDIDANPLDPVQMYVAYASGGLWRSETNGISFEPLFDGEASMTLGDIAVDWARDEIIWVGTGENNSSRSSYAGTGVYRSRDRGESWEHMGLSDTHRIGRIVLHPTDPQTLWVAAVGALYSPSPHRGVYKSSDGGETWTQTLYISDKAGVIDLIIDPTNPDILYAAGWHRERRAWNFVEGGSESGIWKSTDGGDAWERLSADGLPSGDTVGRIGLDIFPSNPEILYALVDNQARRPAEDEEEDPVLTREALRSMSVDEFLALDNETIREYLEDNNFGQQYSAEVIRGMVEEGTLEPVHLVWYVEDANRELFDTPVIGAEVYRSDDGGASWTRTHENYLDRVYNSYGYYFGEIRVAPHDVERIYILGVPFLASSDGGASWESIGGPSVHADHQALWVNPSRPGHLIDGNDGGLNITYDDGKSWFKGNTPSVGQFYAIGVDDQTPYHVYGGLQDNGVWGGPHTYTESTNWHASGEYPYDRYVGGDGMQVEIDTRTNDIIYTGSQFGAYQRIETTTGTRRSIRPRHTLGERPLRFNWQTPIHLSRHNQDILYYGSNKLHRSFNRGDDWETLSGDLTRGGRRGDVPYGTLTTIDESLLQFGLLYVGSDDGLVHVSRDGGYTWENITGEDWGELWVSRVEASNHELGRVYVTLNGYRWDHFAPYVYRSDDFGQTWEALHAGLPMEPVNVILEDPENPALLYLGTDNGLYVSIDGGASFMSMQNGLPHAPVHDLKIQARRQHLLAGTHGRSIYRADIAPLQGLTPEIIESALTVYEPTAQTHSPNWGSHFVWWADYYEPEVIITYWSGSAGQVTVQVAGDEDAVLRTITDEAERGLNFLSYDLSVDEASAGALMGEDEEPLEPGDNGVYYLTPGEYTLTFQLGGAEESVMLSVTKPRNRPRG
ncbi:MAG: glycosyl hydrolase [Bacteroidetes bacterium]|nr:glycosyl hydrolase [Bacteroidota bacterium]